MTQTLDRPVVETREPTPQVPPETPRKPVLIRWVQWLVGIAIVVGLFWVSWTPGLDPSYEMAEQNRFETSRLLTPSEEPSGFDLAEMNRFQTIVEVEP